MPSGFNELCRKCGQPVLGENAQQAIIDFWKKHEVYIGSGTNQLLNHLFLDINCGVTQPVTQNTAPSATSETTPLLPQATAIPIPADDSPEKKALFLRAHGLISNLYHNQLLQTQDTLSRFQGVLSDLRQFSYEAIKNMDEGAVNDLLSLLDQVEPKIQEMAYIAEGRPKPGRFAQLLKFFNTYQPYTALTTLMTTLLPIAVNGIYNLATCGDGPDQKSCFGTGMTVLGAGAGVLFFLTVALVYRSTYDPYTRFVKSFK
ncbi:hypothetical protein [Candidatus Sororendozoicomonas aggregata]|uniref:hypothetical protein n=1 Tax=Candidatus Sororendozoicomonas aggregata TaxID=3073239 RepID=UPI002ED00977